MAERKRSHMKAGRGGTDLLGQKKKKKGIRSKAEKGEKRTTGLLRKKKRFAGPIQKGKTDLPKQGGN